MFTRNLGLLLLGFGLSFPAVADVMDAPEIEEPPPMYQMPEMPSAIAPMTDLTSVAQSTELMQSFAPMAPQELINIGIDVIRPSRTRLLDFDESAQTQVPEPSSLALMGTALAALSLVRRRR